MRAPLRADARMILFMLVLARAHHDVAAFMSVCASPSLDVLIWVQRYLCFEAAARLTKESSYRFQHKQLLRSFDALRRACVGFRHTSQSHQHCPRFVARPAIWSPVADTMRHTTHLLPCRDEFTRARYMERACSVTLGIHTRGWHGCVLTL